MRISRLLLLALVMVSAQAGAKDFNYTQVLLGIESFTSEVDGVDDDLTGTGVHVAGSFGLTPNVAVFASYAQGTADVTINSNFVEIDAEVSSIGFIYHQKAAESVDVLIGASLWQSSADLSVDDTLVATGDDDGYDITVGARIWAGEKLELFGNLTQSFSNEDDDSSSDFDFGGEYYFQEKLSLGLAFDIEDDSQSVVAYISKYF